MLGNIDHYLKNEFKLNIFNIQKSGQKLYAIYLILIVHYYTLRNRCERKENSCNLPVFEKLQKIMVLTLYSNMFSGLLCFSFYLMF